MASSSNNQSSVQFALIVFVMLTVLLGGMTYYAFSKKSEIDTKYAEAQNKEGETSRALNSALEERQTAMTLFGGPTTNFSEAQAAVVAAMQKFGVNQQTQTVTASLEGLRTSFDAALVENTTLKKDLQALRDEVLKLQGNYQQRVDQAKTSQTGSEQQLQKVQADKDEVVQQRELQIAQLREEKQQVEVEREQLRDQSAKMEKELNDRLRNLNAIVDTQKHRIDDLQKTSFEVSDGQLVAVDANLHTVYINLGELDNLKPQVNFSVYTRDHRGVGREARDIKGRIEVTRVVGPHLAQARILEQDPKRPMGDGDPIYSPLFAGGRSEDFAFVGLVDFDNDGRSDRDALHRILKASGARIGLEVNDDGVRTPADAKIGVDTKFLVLGKVPDPSQFPGNDERREKAERIMKEREALLNEARESGVREVRMDDFLAYIGYKPQTRYFVPGQVDRYTLEQGARGASTRTDDPSGGQNSEMFRRAQQKQKESGSYRN